MFSGIVTAVGRIAEVERDGDRFSMWIEAPYSDLAPGDSIAVAGACLTVVENRDGKFRVDAIVTTRGRTRFSDLQPGDRINLEQSLQIGDRLGGHFVQGHVDGVGQVVKVRDVADARLIDIQLPDEVAEVSILHGSIAVEGVSMTVNAIPGSGVIQLSLIPYTLEQTTLGELREGDRVHVEGDMLGKFVRQLLRKES
jgi:riboflavin synthase